MPKGEVKGDIFALGLVLLEALASLVATFSGSGRCWMLAAYPTQSARASSSSLSELKTLTQARS